MFSLQPPRHISTLPKCEKLRLSRTSPLSSRLCCKSRKLQGHEFFAKTLTEKKSPIRIASIALPKPPVSLARGDEAPHIFTRKPHLRPLEFLIPRAIRLLQHNRPKPDMTRRSAKGAGRAKTFGGGQ